jgi:hypothetical protein
MLETLLRARSLPLLNECNQWRRCKPMGVGYVDDLEVLALRLCIVSMHVALGNAPVKMVHVLAS